MSQSIEEYTESDQIKYWVALNKIPGIGPTRLISLENYFGSAKQAWNASDDQLLLCGLDKRSVYTLLKHRASIDPDAEMEALKNAQITPIHIRSIGYPKRLRAIQTPPSVIYVKGKPLNSQENNLAIVGTRKPTDHACIITKSLTTQIVRSGFTVVSGLARGIDSHAHRATMDAKGTTIAVLAGGLDDRYLYANTFLARKIQQQGSTLITEYPTSNHSSPLFHRRNELISGLSKAVVIIVDTGIKSGAMITAEAAIKQNRPVFVVLGKITAEVNKSVNLLIGQGAKLVCSVDEILEWLGESIVKKPIHETKTAKQLPDLAQPLKDKVENCEKTGNPAIDFLSQSAKPVHIDEIGKACNMNASQVSAMLTIMELEGTVIQTAPMVFKKA